MINQQVSSAGLLPWKILIADDDVDVHEATRLALRNTVYLERGLAFFDAYSATETLEILHQHPDMALILLDVIMESDDAGLNVARQIRDEGFSLTRIIVRTGFPGQAPERHVIVNYDIHDYKEKSELTVQKLFTSTISALRAYHDMVSLENHRRSLLSVLESVSWFDFNAIQRYIAGMLTTFANLAGLKAEQVVIVSHSASMSNGVPQVVASLGDWPADGDALQLADLPAEIVEQLQSTLAQEDGQDFASGSTLYFHGHGISLVIYAQGSAAFNSSDKVLLDVFMNTVCQGLSNQQAFANMLAERNAVYLSLAEHAGEWDTHTRNNLIRIRNLVTATAKRLQTTLTFAEEIDDAFVRDIGVAATLHDLGNQSLPPSLLSKPGKLSDDERHAMQTHVVKGLALLHDIFPDTENQLCAALAKQVIAYHHERMDGSGYPYGLQGAEIPLAAKLVAVVDTFIALTSKRAYRAAYPSAEACHLIEMAAGNQFDPYVVQAFLTVINDSPDHEAWL